MTIKSGLQTRVHEVRGYKKRRHPGDIGVEVELEGSFSGLKDGYWTWKEEGSLRNGMEFVLINPVTVANLPKALDDFEAMMKNSTIIKSIRCSTHIHVNVEDLTMEELYNAITAYYLLEEILVRTQGPLRTGNLFCLRMSDAENISHDLRLSLKESAFILDFSQNEHKYGALNLAAPQHFGSLEFRFLLPMTTRKDIEFWSMLLFDLIRNGSRIPVTEQVRRMERGPIDFVRELVGETRFKMLLDMLPASPSVEELLFVNYDHVMKIGNVLDNLKVKQKFKLPKHLWNPDIVSTEEPPRKKKGWSPTGGSPFQFSAIDDGDSAIQAFVAQAGAVWGNNPSNVPVSPAPPPPTDWLIQDEIPQDDFDPFD